jgi:hypothetical protein
MLAPVKARALELLEHHARDTNRAYAVSPVGAGTAGLWRRQAEPLDAEFPGPRVKRPGARPAPWSA